MITATIENMKRYKDTPGLRAFGYSDGEPVFYSANPMDYFWMDNDEALTTDTGDPLRLVVERCQLIDVDELSFRGDVLA